MSRFPWLRGSRSARGTPPIRRALRRHLFLLPILTLVLLLQTGCQSGLSGLCSSCGDGPIRTWFRQRGAVWTRPDACCGGAVASGVPVMEGGAATIAPAPLGSPGSALPAPTMESPGLEPIPSASPGPTPSSGTSSSSGAGGSSGATQGTRAPTGTTGKLNYEAARPGYYIGRGRGSGPIRTYVQRNPSPTYRSAQGVAVASGTGVSAANPLDPRPTELSLLDNLPPLDLPRDDARSEVKTTSVSPADPAPTPVVLPTPVETTASSSAATVTPPLPTEVSVAPGLKRFAVVEPKLAGGSLPSADGLDWLNEKGYKTLVDLREPSDVDSSFLADVSRRGLRYISLPISLTTVDRDHVSRFVFEISLADARPLYFFDADGNRPGMLWYVHRMTDKNESYDPQEATRQAEELGLGNDAFKKAGQTYLDGLKKVPAPAPAPAQAPAQVGMTRPATRTAAGGEPATAAASSPLTEAPDGLPDETTTPAKPETLIVPDAASLDMARVTDPTPPQVDASSTRDPNAWRPFLALLLAALGVPVAYCGRSLIQFRGLVRASLPRPQRRLRSLPAASGE